MNQDQIKVEEAVLSLIDLYVKEDNKDREYLRKYRKNNPDSGLRKEPFISFYNAFESKVSHVEITDFLYHFGFLRTLKTFHYSHHAESLIESFEKLNIPIPHFVLECQKEVIHRKDFIKGYFELEKYKWSQSQREDFLSKIQKEAKNHSFDQKGEKEYLKTKFEETIREVRKIEKEIKSRFGYLVEGFFDGESFKLSKEDLNEYFYHSEIASGGYGSFFEVYKALDQYVCKKNEVFICKAFLSGQNNSIGLELIWMAKPKFEIEYVLDKGYNLGVWNENYQLQTKRNDQYGHGKKFLSNLYHLLIENSIKAGIHYKEVGEILCKFFKVEIGNAQEPFKTFQRGNPKQMDQLKRTFKLS